jgi:hypothetical protein
LPVGIETNILHSDKTYDKGLDGRKVVEELNLMCDPCVGRLLTSARKFGLPVEDDRTVLRSDDLTAPGRLEEDRQEITL